jgi:hypothetical protein
VNLDVLLLLSSVLVGLVFMGLAVPLIKRRVGPNYWYGLRVPATLADEWVWYGANERAGKDLFRLGVVVIVAGLVLWRVGLDPTVKVLVWAGIVAGGAVALAVRGWRYANSLLRERRR